MTIRHHCTGRNLIGIVIRPPEFTIRKTKYDITIKCNKMGYQEATYLNHFRFWGGQQVRKSRQPQFDPSDRNIREHGKTAAPGCTGELNGQVFGLRYNGGLIRRRCSWRSAVMLSRGNGCSPITMSTHDGCCRLLGCRRHVHVDKTQLEDPCSSLRPRQVPFDLSERFGCKEYGGKLDTRVHVPGLAKFGARMPALEAPDKRVWVVICDEAGC